MKMRLLYILYCTPTPAMWQQGSFNPFAILHVPIYRSPYPLRGGISGGGGGGGWAQNAGTFFGGAGGGGGPV